MNFCDKCGGAIGASRPEDSCTCHLEYCQKCGGRKDAGPFGDEKVCKCPKVEWELTAADKRMMRQAGIKQE